ncbi:MAG: AAA family ATPase [Coxiellaceae bacterium]|nr:MAG: AAA family ATPase [Coxiellaceae bacterium]
MMETTFADDHINFNAVNVTNYWQYYGLSQSPFEDTVQYAMYYPFSHLQGHLQFLQLFCRGSNPLLLIEGELGSGKTMLLAQFLGQLDSRLNVFQMKGKATCNAYQLVADIAQGFQLPIVLSQPGLQAQLNAELAAMREMQKDCVLIIDDADLLPTETLAALMHLIIAQDRTHIHLHIILASELHMQAMLENLGQQHGYLIKIPTLTLNPLSVEETQNYLKHRLTKAGLTSKMPFTREMIENIHRLSAGIPGRINRVAQQMLIDMLKPDTQRLNLKAVTRKASEGATWWRGHRIKILSGVMLAVVFVVLWQTEGGMRWTQKHDSMVMNTLINPADPSPAVPKAQAPVQNNPTIASQPIRQPQQVNTLPQQPTMPPAASNLASNQAIMADHAVNPMPTAINEHGITNASLAGQPAANVDNSLSANTAAMSAPQTSSQVMPAQAPAATVNVANDMTTTPSVGANTAQAVAPAIVNPAPAPNMAAPIGDNAPNKIVDPNNIPQVAATGMVAQQAPSQASTLATPATTNTVPMPSTTLHPAPTAAMPNTPTTPMAATASPNHNNAMTASNPMMQTAPATATPLQQAPAPTVSAAPSMPKLPAAPAKPASAKLPITTNDIMVNEANAQVNAIVGETNTAPSVPAAKTPMVAKPEVAMNNVAKTATAKPAPAANLPPELSNDMQQHSQQLMTMKGYTLQILGSRDAADLQRVIAKTNCRPTLGYLVLCTIINLGMY